MTVWPFWVFSLRFFNLANLLNIIRVILKQMSKVGKKINSAFRAVVDQLNEVDEDGDETTLVNLISFKDLLPSRTTTFFRYSGSFTTPGCEEIIIWTVFDDSITISESQVEIPSCLKYFCFNTIIRKKKITAIEI